MENSMEVPQKIKNRTTKCFSNSTPGFLSKENKNSKTIYAPLFIAALFTIAKIWKHLKCPLIGEGIKRCIIYGILFSHKE